MTLLAKNPEAKIIRIQLRQNLPLKHVEPAQCRELEPLLEIADYPKGGLLEHQGDRSMEQYFVIAGILKRVVSNAQGREMILRSPTAASAACRFHRPPSTPPFRPPREPRKSRRSGH